MVAIECPMKRLSYILYLAGSIVVFVITAIGCGHGTDSRSPTATQIIRQVEETYASCNSYSDTGSSEIWTWTISDNGRSGYKEIATFSTKYVRPDHLRFNYNEQGNPDAGFVIRQSGDDVLKWRKGTQEAVHSESLDTFASDTSRMSSKAALAVLSLLQQAQNQNHVLLELDNPMRVNDQRVGTVNCYRVQGQFLGGHATLWIHQEQYLILRIDVVSEYSNRSMQESTIFEWPAVNSTIDPDSLTFHLPGRA